MNLCDVICPIYFIDHDLFNANLKSWFKELPINRILFGINKIDEADFIEKIAMKCWNSKDEIITREIMQTELKTLGACLADLIKRVETDWFFYIHADVRITPKAFCIMKEYMDENIGIIESHREHWEGDFYEYKYNDGESLWFPINKVCDYYYRDRAFSGLQLIQKKAIINLVNRIEDDYIYRNEDIIFQAECLDKEYKYVKTWAMHIHQNINRQWSFDRYSTYMMQFKGIIKYAKFTPITRKACLSAIKILKQEFKVKISLILAFCKKYNSNWYDYIIEKWDDL